MVVRDEPNRPATAAEQEALKQLLDVASDLSKASLLSLLRQCGGDPDKAMEQLYTLASTREEGHMSRYGSSDMGVEIIDDVEPLEDDDPDVAGEEMPVQATGEFGGKFGSSPTGSDDEGVGHRGASKQPTIHTTGQISATYRRATISMGGLINLGCDLDGEPVYSFINEGIRFVDIPIAPGADSGNGMVDAVVVKLDLAVMDDDEFKAVCDSWLLENYSSSEDSDAAVEFDYGAGGEFSVPKKAAATRSDPTEFRAYLNALLNESPEERARRIEQERLDDFLAQELYEEELREYERQWPGPPRPVVSDPAPAAPPAPTSATNPATEAMLLYDKLDTNSRAAYAPPATRVAPVSAAPRKPRPPGMRHHHRGAGGPQSQITVPSHRDVYAPRSIQVLLPASVRAVAIQNIVNPALERRFTEAACRMRRLGYAVTVDIAYHGTESTATSAISRGGFIAPLGSRGHTLSHRSGNSGFYGNGIYLTPHASIAQGYSSSGKIIVCNVLRGRAYKCPGLTMGASLKPGYSSHESPCGSEWVFFSAAQVLPVAIVHFGTQSVGRPEVLDPIASNQVDDPTELAMASANAELTRDVRKKQQQVMTPAKVAHLEALPATRLSNRDRKILNRIRKGKGLQQQTDVATGGRRRR